ncbi:hypothetical protein PINS_up023189 [Pythium insidiosum]|nr:hypothetical protein PINS_up023189 [Pythium insidiosum]
MHRHSFSLSNKVDAHFHRHFNANEIYELHGSVETWQCAGDADGKGRKPCDATWQLPKSARFVVDRQTMRADGRAITTCPQCGGQARPNVLMFHDKNWIANTDEEVRSLVAWIGDAQLITFYLSTLQERYVAWEAVMEQVSGATSRIARSSV